MNNGFILTDIAGTTLDSEERELLNHPVLFGILLFARNYMSPEQLRDLTSTIHKINPALVIAVDQEGGRVQRFTSGFSPLKPMSYWGEYYDKNPEAALTGLRQQTISMVTELQNCGIQVSLAPVLDVDYQVSDIIGERSFHKNPDIITRLAKCVINAMHAHKMPSIGKHFPGHGAVALDSHLELPVDTRPWELIWEQDMKPYRNLLPDLDSIMPAHIIYPAIDGKRPAGFSKKWVSEVLRNNLNYQGLVITDDLSMAAASAIGSYAERAAFALEAGCDILTICNKREGLLQLLNNHEKYANLLTHRKVRKYISIFR